MKIQSFLDSASVVVPAADIELLLPVRVIGTTGNVSNANTLTTNYAEATLTMVLGGPVPSVTLDYGCIVSGLPVFHINAIFGHPTLQAVYAEAEVDLDENGDAGIPDGAEYNVSYVGNAGSASLSRVNTFQLTTPTEIVSRLVQGGQRFQIIRLTKPGSITLSSVGVRPLTSRSTRRVGYFMSSDPTLDEIWDIGAKTIEIGTVPTGNLPTTWTITPQGMVVQDSAFSVYQAGTKWAEYTAEFDLQILKNEAGWMVGANPTGGYRLVLAANDDEIGTPNTIRLTHPFVAGTLEQVTLPFELKIGIWYRVRTVTGSSLQVYVDEQLIFDSPISSSSGSFGFAGYDGSIGLFRNLKVSGENGTLLDTTLTEPAILDAFGAGTNYFPTIIDGAKRDRYVWSGDLAVSAPTIYYATGATDAVSGSLSLFAAYQRSNGMFPGNLPPQLAPNLANADVMPDTYYYSLSYSIYFLTTLYEYYLYTGDVNFVRENWDKVRRSFAYLNSLTNTDGLIVTNESNCLDWHPHSKAKLTGTVTEFNILYYGALLGGAQLAEALNDTSAKGDYAAQATRVMTAVNSTLYDSDAGLYTVSDKIRVPVAQDANALAILYGIAPREKWESILDNMATALSTINGPLAFSLDYSDLSQLISPFISSFDVAARFKAGDAKGALSIIRTVWGHMRSESSYYSGTTWEAIAINGIPLPASQANGSYTSLAHGWSSGPTFALSKYVLGVRPLTAGYLSWIVEPQLGDLQWAQGKIPTPHGTIEVQWHAESVGFRLMITVPVGTKATIGVPVAREQNFLSVNGKFMQVDVEKINSDGTTRRVGYIYLRDLPAGSYQILDR